MIYKMRSGFKLPGDYFDGFQQRLEKLMDEDALSSDSKKLDIASGYKVPQDYFEELHIDMDDTRPSSNKKVWMAVAALLVVLLSVGILTRPFSSDADNIQISDIKDEQLDQYINDQYMNEEVLEIYSNGQNLDFKIDEALRSIDKKEILTYFDDQFNDLYAYEE